MWILRELIESKEQNVEKFYNEDSIEDNTLSPSNDAIQAKNKFSLEDNSNCNTGLNFWLNVCLY